MWKLSAALALVLSISTSALAQPTSTAPTKGAMKVCKSDKATLCAGVVKGKPMHQCMKDNMAKLSAPCQAAIQAKMAAKQAAKAAGPN